MTTDPAKPSDPFVHASSTAGRAFAESVRAWGGRGDSAAALASLRAMLRAEAVPDLGWIHPTWLVRALQDESPAVRAVVAAHGPPVVRRALIASGVVVDFDRDPHPEALAWVSALWTERLVGGAVEVDDPPAIVALTRLSPLEGYRLWHAVGQVKMLLALGPDEGSRLPGAARRAPWIFERLGPAPAETQSWARRDLDLVLKARLGGRRRAALLGLLSLARLLVGCEPFRVRWALQHLPYPIVKRVRSLMRPPSKRATAVSRLETLILKTGWDRLALENRIATPFPTTPTPERTDDDR